MAFNPSTVVLDQYLTNYNSREVIDSELDRLENLKVIEKVEHSAWAAYILVVKKSDGSARLCIDYSTGQ
jgi:hypothetical protein